MSKSTALTAWYSQAILLAVVGQDRPNDSPQHDANYNHAGHHKANSPVWNDTPKLLPCPAMPLTPRNNLLGKVFGNHVETLCRVH